MQMNDTNVDLDALAEEVTKPSAQPVTTQTPPSISVEEQASRAMQVLVEQISNRALQQLSAMRDGIDDVTLALKQKEQHLYNQVFDYAKCVDNALKLNTATKPRLQQLKTDIASGMPETMPAIENKE